VSEIKGRGAWPSTGTGGTYTRKNNEIVPGPFYMLHEDPMRQIGLKTYCQRAESRPVGLNYNAVFHGVVAIQLLCNAYLGSNHSANLPYLSGDGIFGPQTDRAVRLVQTSAGLKADGMVGRNTMKVLLTPRIKLIAAKHKEPWEPLVGIMTYEGAWDPGAVGGADPNDLGLVQINTIAHPHVSFSDAFCPSFAINYAASLIRAGLDAFNGDIRLAIASYNLGIGGTRQWVAAGSPSVWTPPWSTFPRRVDEYVNKILQAA
jgi:peptidoglycan hydrolase-like protein with peptidoglycan-binding domain